MTSNHAQKQIIRDRMSGTRETYTQARLAHVPEPPTRIRVYIDFGAVSLSHEQQEAYLEAERTKEGSGWRFMQDLVEAHLKRLLEDEEYRDETDLSLIHIPNLDTLIQDTLDGDGSIDFTTRYKSEEDARYKALNQHKADAVGQLIEEYREEQRWRHWDLTDAEWDWLESTERVTVFRPGPEDANEGYEEEEVYALVDGKRVNITDEMMSQFYRDYYNAH